MVSPHQRRWTTLLRVVPCFLLFSMAAASESSESPSSLVEVYWKSARTVVVPGVSNIVVLDEEVTRAEVSPDSVRFYGLKRGETVAIGFREGNPVSLRIRVIERPQAVVPPSLLRQQAEMAQGYYASTAEMSDSNGSRNISILDGFSWSQLVGSKSHLDFSGQMIENTQPGAQSFNIRSGTLAYSSPNLQGRLFDFNVDLLNPSGPQFFSPGVFAQATELRGASVNFEHGQDRFGVFAGVTIPYFYLSLGGTRDVAGFFFVRQPSSKLSFFSTTTFINTPQQVFVTTANRNNYVMQAAGVNYILDKRWKVQGAVGTSNHGSLARGEVDYTGHRVYGFAAATTSSPLFPLNQIQSLFAGTSSVTTAWTVRQNDRIAESLYAQHVATAPLSGILTRGASDYISPGVSWHINSKHDVNFTYTRSHNTGGFSNSSLTGNRFYSTWHTLLSPRISNTAQLTLGSLQDPLQLSSEQEFMVQDSVSFAVPRGSMLLSFQDQRNQPSLVQKLNSELYLLTPALQAAFLRDPVAFITSDALPPEIRAILNAQQPIDISLSAAAQFAFGRKLSLNPNFSFARTSNGNAGSWSPFFGYSLRYQVTPTLQLISSMNTLWVLPTRGTQLQRTTLVSAGFMKSFHAIPSLPLIGHQNRVIEGRVFRDNNVDGRYNLFEPGFAGIQVQLEDGESVLTDNEGRYKFSGVTAGAHQVSVSLSQFRDPVRMTTHGTVDVDLIRDRTAVVNFGIIDFARVMGNLFNDLRLENSRKPDATGIGEVHLILSDGKQQKMIVTQSNGDYEARDVSPGDYTLSVDSESLPANYAVPKDSFPIHVVPLSTIVVDIPVHAMRSISGKVLLRTPTANQLPQPEAKKTATDNKRSPDSATQSVRYQSSPLAHVTIAAGAVSAVTDEQGNFLLRSLPAGDLTITLVPVKELPAGLKLPTGAVHMPDGPVQVQDAIIAINNPELVPYLVVPATETKPASSPQVQ
jgi:hypothetical protein